MQVLRSSRLLAATFSAAALLVGCGGADEEIPPQAASALVRGMDEVEQGVRAGECEEAGSTLRRLGATVRGLPQGTDTDVRATLERGVGHLEQLARRECRQREPEPVVEEPIAPPVEPEPTPEPAPTVTEPQVEPDIPVEPEEPAQEEPIEEEEPAAEEPDQPKQKEPKEPKQPKEDDPEEVEDICGSNPDPTC